MLLVLLGACRAFLWFWPNPDYQIEDYLNQENKTNPGNHQEDTFFNDIGVLYKISKDLFHTISLNYARKNGNQSQYNTASNNRTNLAGYIGAY